MDELEFRKQVYANPEDPGAEALAAAQANPAYQQILEQAQKLDTEVRQLMNSVVAPPGLVERLQQIPDHETGETAGAATSAFRKASLFQYYAIAASLMLAVGIVFTVILNQGPSPAAVSLGDRVLAHVRDVESAHLENITTGTLTASYNMAEVNQVMANAGSTINSDAFMNSMPVRYANPCLILPGFRSAHLILESTEGPLSVIVINNSPVSQDLQFSDERFNGVIVPMESGNLILLGDENSNPARYRQQFTENLGWII